MEVWYTSFRNLFPNMLSLSNYLHTWICVFTNQYHIITVCILTMCRTYNNRCFFSPERKTTRFMYAIIIPVKLDYFRHHPPPKPSIEQRERERQNTFFALNKWVVFGNLLTPLSPTHRKEASNHISVFNRNPLWSLNVVRVNICSPCKVRLCGVSSQKHRPLAVRDCVFALEEITSENTHRTCRAFGLSHQ